MSGIFDGNAQAMKRLATLLDCITAIKDPRIDRNKSYPLSDVIMIAVCGVLGGADNWSEIEWFGEDHIDWFRTFLGSDVAIPSHDTFARVFSLIDPNELHGWLELWLSDLRKNNEFTHIACDGKMLKGTRSGNPLTLVRAWSRENGLVLGQVRVQQKSNEIIALPKLLQSLFLEGKIVSIDAIGTQKKIAAQIAEQKGDYVLALKKNQHQFYKDIALYMSDVSQNRFPEVAVSYCETKNKNHGRMEIRRCWATDELKWCEQRKQWARLNTIVRVESIVTRKNKTQTSVRLYISSLPANAEHILDIIRGHWSIENQLFWSLDVVFNEDRSTIRKYYGPENFGILRTFCLSILKNKKKGVSFKRARMSCAVNQRFLLEMLLFQGV